MDLSASDSLSRPRSRKAPPIHPSNRMNSHNSTALWGSECERAKKIDQLTHLLPLLIYILVTEFLPVLRPEKGFRCEFCFYTHVRMEISALSFVLKLVKIVVCQIILKNYTADTKKLYKILLLNNPKHFGFACHIFKAVISTCSWRRVKNKPPSEVSFSDLQLCYLVKSGKLSLKIQKVTYKIRKI